MTTDREIIQNAAWQFNEAVSLLREARNYMAEFTGCAEEIDEGLPAIQEALEALAQLASSSTEDGGS